MGNTDVDERRVRAIHYAHPEWSAARIARELGYSGQESDAKHRIEQILDGPTAPTAPRTEPPSEGGAREEDDHESTTAWHVKWWWYPLYAFEVAAALILGLAVASVLGVVALARWFADRLTG